MKRTPSTRSSSSDSRANVGDMAGAPEMDPPRSNSPKHARVASCLNPGAPRNRTWREPIRKAKAQMNRAFVGRTRLELVTDGSPGSGGSLGLSRHLEQPGRDQEFLAVSMPVLDAIRRARPVSGDLGSKVLDKRARIKSQMSTRPPCRSCDLATLVSEFELQMVPLLKPRTRSAHPASHQRWR